jgi:hypothetical protein
MSRRTLLIAVLFLWGADSTHAQYPYYYKNKWYPVSGPKGKYYYTHYYYGAKAYHHVYYYPYRSKRYVYYYNWKTKKYWGRYDLETGRYSLLEPDKRKENLEDIKESDFPPPKPLETCLIPGSTETMTAPPMLPKEV